MRSVSVIIPVKDREDVIPRAIRSVLAQTAPVHEIIVADDGSSDDSSVVAANFHSDRCPIRIVSFPVSRGAPAARNAGAQLSTGDYLAFLDSDDAWKPQKLERQLTLLEQKPLAPAAFTLIETRKESRVHVSPSPEVVSRLNLEENNVLGSCSTALVLRSAFFDCGKFDETLPSCQDWDLWLRLSDLGDLLVVQEPLTEYYFDGGARISRNPSRVTQGHLAVFKRIRESANRNLDLETLQRVHATALAEAYLYSVEDRFLCMKYLTGRIIRNWSNTDKIAAARIVYRALVKAR